jgi:Cu/Ag efflux protein CusF
MRRSLVCAFAVLTLVVSTLPAQPSPLKGKLKKVDADNRTVTITIDGKDLELTVTDKTMFQGASGKDVQERLKSFKEGADVEFLSAKQDGKLVLRGMRPAGFSQTPEPPPKVDLSQFKPLTELGTGEYHGFKGGLYPDGKNERPAAHEAAGVALAKQVQPLDRDGKPSTDGKIVLLSVGMSNTAQSSEGLQRLLRADTDKDPSLVFVNGAQGGMTAKKIQGPNDNDSGTEYWSRVDQILKQAGVSRAQVQAIWIKQADAGPSEGFPKYAQTLQAELTRIVQIFPERFPNAKLVYLSSRTFGGYAKTRLNPEPYAYESGFSVKWLIEEQIKGDKGLNFDAGKGAVKAPWLSWGPYLWANGATRRADGFSWDEKDFIERDRTHQSPSGQEKVGKLLLEFFKTDTTTRPWFVRR